MPRSTAAYFSDIIETHDKSAEFTVVMFAGCGSADRSHVQVSSKASIWLAAFSP